MKNALGLFCATVALAGMMMAISGCSQGVVAKSGPDKLMEDMISSMNELADAVEAGKSDAQVDKLHASFEKARKKFAALPAKDQTLPSTKYMVQSQAAQKRMATAMIAHSMNKMKSMQMN